ncbi:MAG: hypothetical protein AAFU77_18285, partial [Myxococcota bacterium]
GIDNDGDGFIDCDDFDCPQGIPVVAEFCRTGSGEVEEENTVERCQDGDDNDGNGFIDCDDFSCSRSDDPALQAFCNELQENTLAKCSDGVDNDGNGFIDCGDFSCSRTNDPAVRVACQESIHTVDTVMNADDPFLAINQANANCVNGIDDDNDGFVDCEDFDCAWNPIVTGCTGPRVCE